MQRKPTPRAGQREAVLAVLNSDGFVEIYAGDHVDVRIVNAVHCETLAGEVSAERLIEQSLPRRFRDVYFPGNRRGFGMVETVTVDDCWQRATESGICKIADRLAQGDEKDGTTCPTFPGLSQGGTAACLV